MSLQLTPIQLLQTHIEEILKSKQEDNLLKEKKIVDSNFSSKRKKNLIRYVYIIIDTTHTCVKTDLKPSRIGATVLYLKDFLTKFFDQNPLSVLSLSKAQQGQCFTVQEFTSNIGKLETSLEKINVDEVGTFSLIECLNEVFNIFNDVPPYGHKEVILIQSSPSTQDKGNIYEFIEKAKKVNFTFSIISLNAKTHIFNQLAEQTQGKYETVINEKDYQDILNQYCEPPEYIETQVKKELIHVGFPNKLNSRIPFLCQCHLQLKYTYYECPQCKSKNCEVPSKCSVCMLNLLLPLHITKSYQQNANLKNYNLVNIQDRICAEGEEILWCYGCNDMINTNKYISVCPECQKNFCLECDILIHKQKMLCPGCD